MLGGISAPQVYIVCGYTDMRRSIDGLSAIIKQNYSLEPFSGSLFLFCGKRRDRMKALMWDGDEFLLMYKRLDNGGFQWPRGKEDARLLSKEQKKKRTKEELTAHLEHREVIIELEEEKTDKTQIIKPDAPVAFS